MGEKDISEKQLLDYNDVFADIVNVLLYEGKRVILPETLERAQTISQYKSDDSKLHEEERDVSKYWKDGEMRISMFGIENQTDLDTDMPFRMHGYDGAAYRQQLLDGKERFPVVSLVLYYGEKHWKKNRRLKERIRVPNQLDPYVNDYKVNIFEIAWLSDEQIAMFQSDFRIVADFFVQKRKYKDYVPSTETIEHVDAVLKLLSVFAKDDDYLKFSTRKEGREVNMCEILQSYIRKGREEGRENAISDFVKSCLKKGWAKETTINHVIDFFGLDETKACEIVESNWE